MSAHAEATTSRLTVRKLHPALGAEVRGVDMRAPLDADTFRELHDIWMEHLVLVFPGQHITDAEHVAFTRYFGEPEIFHQKIIRSERVKEIFRVSNVDENNVLMPPDHPVAQQVALAQFWHTDSSYRQIPCTGALLHGVEVSRTGGETQFTNMYLVYDSLPDALKRQIEGRKAKHDFGHMHTQAALKPLTEEEKAAMPAVWQPMVRKGLVLTNSFYWDLSPQTRAWTDRYVAKMGKPPTEYNAGAYAGVLHWLKAVKAAATLDADATAAKMRELPLDDFYNSNGRIMANGCVPHTMYLWQVKPASEAKHHWDLFNQIGVMPTPEAFPPAGLFGCRLTPA